MAGTWRLLIGQLRRATLRKGTSSSPPPPATASADLDEKPAASFLEPSGASAAAAEPAVCALSVPAIVLRAEQRVGEAEGEAQSSQTHACGTTAEKDRRCGEQACRCRSCCCPRCSCCPETPSPPSQDFPLSLDGCASASSLDECCHASCGGGAASVAAAAQAHPQKFPMAKYAASMRRAIIKLASRPFADSVGSLVPSYKRQPGAGASSAAACCPEPQLSRAEVIGLLCKTVPRCNVVLPRSGFVFGVDLENLPPVVTSEVVFERGLRCRVPLIVERCARYILESGTDVVGVFRVCGSIKRMKELRTLFDTPPAFGRDVQLGRRCAYSVHDCAGVLKRYLMELPQPVIPWELYSTFREVELLAESNGASALTKPSAAKALAEFIRDLPSMNRDLLLFLTGTLAVFSSYSCSTLMCVDNLAAVFQPGLLNHPKHARDPAEYARNQRVVAALVRHNLTLFADPGLEKLPPAGAQGRGPTCSRETASLIPPDVAAGVPRPPRQRDRPLPRNSAGPQQYRDWPAGAPPPPPPPAEPDPSGEVPAGDQPSSPAQPRNPSAARAPRSRQPPPPPLLTTLAPAPHRGPPCSASKTSPRRQRAGCTLQRNHARRNRRGWHACPRSTPAAAGPAANFGAAPAPASCFPPRSPTASCFLPRSPTAAARDAAGGQLVRWPSFLSDRPKRSSTVAPSVPRRSATISVMPPPPDDPDAKQREAVSRAARPDAREPAARRDGRERRSAAEEAAAAPRRPDVSHPR